MSRGVFSEDFLDIFEDVIGDIFNADFPSNSVQAPDPQSSEKTTDAIASVPLSMLPDNFGFDLPEKAAPTAAEHLSVLPDDFDFGLPEKAAHTAAEHLPASHTSTSLSAAVSDYGPLFAPGGGGGGKPDSGGGKPDKGDGGGPGGGGNGGNAIHAEWVSGNLAPAAGEDPFNIEVELYGDASFWDGDLGLALEGYLQAAADFISGVVSQGFTNDAAMFHSYDTGTSFTVDDLLVEVYVEGFKGRNSNTIAAETQIFAANDFNADGVYETPAGATITFNLNLIDNLDFSGVLDDTVLHEMLHTLGFGLWETAGNDLTTTSEGQITYTGTGAFGKIVENEGLTGSVGGHWSEAVYDRELMTSIVETTDNMFLAEYSVATLADLAVVDVEAANETGYTLASDWQAQVEELNNAALVGIDLDAWALG